MTYPRPVDNFKQKFTETLFPAFCLGCSREGYFLCPDCFSVLDISEFDFCLCERSPVKIFGQGKCSKCKDKKLDKLFFALSYKESPLAKKLVRAFKYEPFVRNLAGPLAQVIARHFIITGANTDLFWENSVIIPVPLHISRLKARGYNQSEELAKELSKIVKIPVVNCLQRIKKTLPQVDMKKQERVENMKDAFALSQESKKMIKNKKVFLLDDVYTTGSTTEECARVLKKSGIRQVFAICLARETFS